MIALQAVLILGFDVTQLAGLLYLTGGLQNPFCILLLAPVVVSATTLAQRYTIILGVLVILVSGFLSYFHMPLPWHAGENFVFEPLYLCLLYTSPSPRDA